MALIISSRIKEKLSRKEPPVTEEEIIQCFANCVKRFLLDSREEHKTNPPTQWFVSETDFGRKLKIVFIKQKNGDVEIKSAFNPNEEERRIYKRLA